MSDNMKDEISCAEQTTKLTCPKCSKFFLRQQCMLNHVKSRSTKKSKWKTLDEFKRAVPIVQAMGVLHNVRSLDASDVLQKKTENDSNLPL